MEVLKGTPTVLADRQAPLKYIFGTQDNSLWMLNVSKGENDKQLAEILNLYNTFLHDGRTLLGKIIEYTV